MCIYYEKSFMNIKKNVFEILNDVKNMVQDMIIMTSISDIEIVETGLESGDKLYKVLLIKSAELERTSNNLIFMEREPYCLSTTKGKLKMHMIMKNMLA